MIDRALAQARASLARVEFDALWNAGTIAATTESLLAAAATVGDSGASRSEPAAPQPPAAPVAPTQAPTAPAPSDHAHHERPHETGSRFPKLSQREQEVFGMIVRGHHDREIAEAHLVTTRTVSWHVTNIFTKLGVNSRVAAAVLAIREGLIESASIETPSPPTAFAPQPPNAPA